MRRRKNVSHEENEDSKVYKGFLYREKKQCFARRKRRFEGLKLFSTGRRKNVSHEENEDSKVYKGFLYKEKKESFTRRKRRFEGFQKFSLRAVSWGLGYYFKNTSPSCWGALRGEEGMFHTKKTKIGRFTKVFITTAIPSISLRYLFDIPLIVRIEEASALIRRYGVEKTHMIAANP
jgi:hypothetical protein